jgi:hypothetical protein
VAGQPAEDGGAFELPGAWAHGDRESSGAFGDVGDLAGHD